MNVKSACIVLLAACYVQAYENKELEVAEPRGKGKYALLMHFFYVAATKLIILKVVYGIIFYAIVVKGWHFFTWFVHYLKNTKSHHHEYIKYEPEPYHAPEYGHDLYGGDHYAQDSYGPYAYDRHNYGDNSFKEPVYDADGSYSIKS